LALFGGIAIRTSTLAVSAVNGGGLSVAGGFGLGGNAIFNSTLEVFSGITTSTILSTGLTTGNIQSTGLTTGNINFTGALYQNGVVYLGSQWSGTNGNSLYYGSTGSTYVGINTSTPSFNLDVSGGARITTGLSTGTILSTGLTTGNINFTGALYQNGVAYLGSQWSGTNGNLLYYGSTGTTYVGINTSTPSFNLDVSGGARITTGITTGTILSTGLTTGNINFTGALYQNGVAYLGSQWSGTNGNLLYYGSTGTTYVGINTSTPSFNLDVSGGARITTGITTGTILSTGLTTGNINFTGALFQNSIPYIGSQWTGTNGNNLFYGSTGSVFVGIGTTNPTNTLTVNGSMSVSGNTTLANVYFTNLTTGSFYTNTLSVNNSSYVFAGSCSAGNNINTATDLLGLILPTATTISFTVVISVSTIVSSGPNFFTQYTVEGIQTDSGWIIDDYFIGDIPNITFTITSTGQLQYTSNLVVNWTSTTLRYQATGIFLNASSPLPNIPTSGNFYLNGQLIVSDSTNSTNTSVGSIQTAGGVGITKNLTVGGGATFGGHLIPSTNITQDLGSSTNRWRDIYLSGNTINLGGTLISATNGGTAIAFGSTIFTTTTVGNIGSSISNLSSDSISTGTIYASTGITSAALLVTGMITASSVQATSSTVPNVVHTNISTGTINASTGITSGALLVTGMITASSVQATSSTIPNVVHTNISTGTINASTGITSGALLVTGMITASSVQATSSTIPNVVTTNISTGTINASTGITSATLLVTGMITAGSVQATSSTIPNVVTTNISTGTLRGTDLFLTGTLTTVNITTQNLLVTTNSITVGSLLVSGGNLNMTGGNLNMTGGSINITGGALNVSGNISSASTISALVFTGGSLQISGTTSTSNLVATRATIPNMFITTNLVVNNIGRTDDFSGNGLNGVMVRIGGNRIFTETSGLTNIPLLSDVIISSSNNLYDSSSVGTNVSIGSALTVGLAPSGSGNLTLLNSYSLYVLGNSRINGSLMLTSGSLNIFSGSINISDGSVNITGGALNVSGNISSASTISGNVFTGGSLSISGTTSTGTLVATTATIPNIIHSNITSSSLVLKDAGVQVLLVGSTGGSQPTSAAIRNTSGSLEMCIPGAATEFSSSAIAGDVVLRQNNTIKNMMFQIGSASAHLYLASSGNVGISIAAPTVKLDVAGTTRITNTTATSIGSLTVAGPGLSTYTPATTTIGQLATFFGPGGGGIISNIDLSTFIPGTNSFNLPSVRFSMLDLGAANSTFNILTRNTGATGTMASRIMIDGSGNVGISTTSPTSSLHVAGLITGNPSGNGVHLGIDSSAYSAIQLNSNIGSYIDFSSSGVDTLGRIFYDNASNKITITGNLTTSTEANIIGTLRVTGGTYITSAVNIATNVNPTTVSGGGLNVAGDVILGSEIIWTTATGVAAPTFSNRSVGTRLVLAPAISASVLDYALGIETNNMWFGSPNGFKWYNNNTGASMQLTGSNLIVTGDILVFGTISDIRLKNNVQPITNGLNKINELRPVTFNWKDDIFNVDKQGTSDSGFIAQEVETVIPHAVSEYPELNSGIVYKNMKHERIIPYLVSSIQELTKQNSLLTKRIEILENKLNF
jgi:hypothetical protein